MIVDIDIGNTRIKWRIAGQSEIFHFDASDDLPEQWKTPPCDSRFRVSSVLTASQTRHFCERLASLSTATVEIATVKNSVGGVLLAYRDVASFGVDRWLALLAARIRQPATDCIVIHAGTALVADFLRGDGQHLGGYIVSGRQTSLRSLGEAAQLLEPAVGGELNAPHEFPGATTMECIAAGSSLLFRGFLRELACAASMHLNSPAWLFAGGDADQMLQLYEGLRKTNLPESCASGDPHLVSGLVLDGLAIALP